MKFLNSLCLLLLFCCAGIAQHKTPSSPIYNGVPWFNTNGDIVNAHGACIVEDDGKYYLFGEYKTDSVNMFIGFSCYSSTDLVNWTFERLVLPQQKEGPLGPNRVGERVKVMKSPTTGEYVMYMHTDNMQYKDPAVGYATSKAINGEYTFQGPLLYEGKPIRKWDMGTFQDHDGTGYLLVHHGDIYRLSNDFRSAEKKVASGIPGSGESPAMFKKNGIYYLLSSGLTSWERNDNVYHTAPTIEGPWTNQGLFCPEGTLTHNSQCSFVFPVPRDRDTLYMYMGDRWSFPKQGQAATQVWLPLQASGTELRIPEYWEAWDFQTFQPVTKKSPIGLPGNQQLQSNRKGDFVTIPYDGSSIGLIGTSSSDGGYALISIVGKDGDTLRSSLVDFYSKVPHIGLRYVTPKIAPGDYTLHVEVSGEHGVWSDKRRSDYGSTDYWIRIQDVVLLEADDRKAAQEYMLPSDNRNNPVIQGYYADPEILYAEKTGKYYLYPTSDGFHSWNGYRFKVFSSDDLKNWKDEGVMLDLKRDAPWAAANAWAPCIIERKTDQGYRYYYYYSGAKNIGVAVAEYPTGPFTDLGRPLIPRDSIRGQEIDPDVFHDPVSDKYFLYWGNAYMRVAELNDDMVSIKPETVKVLTPDKTYREGAYVIHRQGKYYFFWSENDTRDENYRVRYAISDSPVGPLTIPDNNLILAKDTTKGIYGTGHHSVIQVPGKDEWYIVYHRFRRPNAKGMGWAAGYNREVCIDRMEFNADGTIRVVEPTL